MLLLARPIRSSYEPIEDYPEQSWNCGSDCQARCIIQRAKLKKRLGPFRPEFVTRGSWSQHIAQGDPTPQHGVYYAEEPQHHRPQLYSQARYFLADLAR